MAKRRGRGDGSIYQRKSDGLWVGVADLGWEAGKRRRKTVYGKTRGEVVTKLRKVQTNIDKALPTPDERITTERYLRWWATEVLPTRRIKASTADGYVYTLNHYVIPYIGKVRLARLGPEHVHAMLRSLDSKGMSARTQRQARAVLSGALRHAEQWGWVARNAARLVEAPGISGHQVDDALDIAEADALLGAARGDRLEALVTVALAVGVRRGEALALRWDEDIDLDAGTLTVRRTLKRRTGHGLVTDTPKTDSANRIIPLPDICIEALRQHKRRQEVEKDSAGKAWTETGYVFTTPVGTPIDPRNLTRHYHQITTRAGLGPRRFHALRHSAATLMLTMGVPLEVISTTLGHAGYSITADFYAKVRPVLQMQAAEAMNRALTGPSEASLATTLATSDPAEAPEMTASTL